MTNYEIAQFLSAGKAEFVLYDSKHKNRFRYKIDKVDKGKFFVSLHLSAYDESGYGYLGLINNSKFRDTAKSVVSPETDPFLLFDLFFFKVMNSDSIPSYIDFAHLGKCGKCGRTLTDPISIECGLGPVCGNRKST